MRWSKELTSWKLWLPNLVLTVVTLGSFFALFDVPRQLEFEVLGAKISVSIWVPILAFVMVLLILHEGFHALPFLLFGRNRPGFQLRFGFFGVGAYASANCLLSRKELLIVAVTPLLAITLFGAFLWVLMPSWVPWLYLSMAVNTAGAVGDVWITWLLLRADPQALCLDSEYEMAIFEPTP